MGPSPSERPHWQLPLGLMVLSLLIHASEDRKISRLRGDARKPTSATSVGEDFCSDDLTDSAQRALWERLKSSEGMKKLYEKMTGKSAPHGESTGGIRPSEAGRTLGVERRRALLDNITEDAEKMWDEFKTARTRKKRISSDYSPSPRACTPDPEAEPPLEMRGREHNLSPGAARVQMEARKRSASPVILDRRERHNASESTISCITNDGLSDWSGSSQVQVDFEFFDPNRTTDFRDVASILEDYGDAGWKLHPDGPEVFDCIGMTDTIINQSERNFDSGLGRVGTIIRGLSQRADTTTTGDIMTDATSAIERAKDGKNGAVVAVASMVNLFVHKNEKWVGQLKRMLEDATEGIQDEDLLDYNLGGRHRLLSALRSKSSVLLILERIMLNLPTQLTHSATEAVMEEVTWAATDEPDPKIRNGWKFQKCIMILRGQSSMKAVNKFRKKPRWDKGRSAVSDKAKGDLECPQEGHRDPPRPLGCIKPGDVIYSNPEEVVFHEESEFSAIFQTHTDKTQGEGAVRVVLVLSSSGLEAAREKLKKQAEEAKNKAEEREAEKKAQVDHTQRRGLKVPW